MPPHKTLKSVRCRAGAQAINNFYNAIPLHEREAAIKAERHLEPGVLLIMIAALRAAAAGLGWVCSPCKSATCSTQKRGYKANSLTPVKAVNWSRVGFPTFAAGSATETESDSDQMKAALSKLAELGFEVDASQREEVKAIILACQGNLRMVIEHLLQ